MPYAKLQFQPGIYTENTDVDSANRYVFGNHTRFYKGFPKKVGGSVKTSMNTFLGMCRGMDAWVTLEDRKYIGLGTNLKLYIDEGGSFYDITPIEDDGTLGNDPISTTIGSPIVTITDVAHGRSAGDYVSFSGATAVGGITVSGEYTVTQVLTANTYTITASINATSTATGGGAAVAYEYQIPIGPANTLVLGGWGAGPWGGSTWGTPRTTSTLFNFARTWVVSNYGEDLIASPRDGAIYLWTASTGTSVRAQLIATAPSTNKFVVVSPEDRYIIAMGAHDGSDSDPMLIRWSSQNDYNDWTPTTTNTAGDKRLSEGNLVITGVSSRGQIIISTDTTIYAMFPDSEFVFGFKTLGIGGCISPNGMVEYNGVVYWIGSNNFYMYDGTIQVMTCDVRQYVFDSLNALQSYKVFAWVNSTWNEIWYFYQDTSGTECNRYVAHNLDGSIWHIGTWDRTAGLDKGVVTSTPIATGSNGYVYAQESGVDDDGLPLTTSYTTGSPQNHDRFTYIKKMLPNFKTLTGNIEAVFETKLYMQDDSPVTSAAYPINSGTNYICPRVRGDEFNITFTSDEIGGDFFAGTMEVELMPVGAR